MQLSIVQAENIVEDPVRTAFRHKLEGLAEHLRILFLIDLDT